MSHVGHVALLVPPPCIAGEPPLLGFDPLPLRGLGAAFHSALAAAGETPAAQPHDVVLRYLAASSWPVTGRPWQVTSEDAHAVMLAHRRQFLAREPYQRPAGHHLPEA